MIQALWALLGLGLLAAGGEAMVRGALAAARRLRVSPLLAGLVIVGFGTSAPEMVVSVSAALDGLPEIAVGNVVGSNIGNILLILAICALVVPLTTNPDSLKRDGLAMLGATILFLLLARDGLSRLDGVMFLVALAAFMIWAYRSEVQDPNAPDAKRHQAGGDLITRVPMSVPLMLLLLIGGLSCLVLGARLLVSSAVAIGQQLGIPEVVMGLTLVAVGTSLPELAVSVVAALRRQSDVAVGNILGSNIFNILGIMGVSALVSPLAVTGRLAQIDQWVMLGAAGLLLVFLWTGLRLSRVEAAIMIAAYGVYVAFMIL